MMLLERIPMYGASEDQVEYSGEEFLVVPRIGTISPGLISPFSYSARITIQ